MKLDLKILIALLMAIFSVISLSSAQCEYFGCAGTGYCPDGCRCNASGWCELLSSNLRASNNQ